MKLLLTVLAFLFVTPALADHTSFYVVNRSPVDLTHVYATSVVNRQFGQDLLGDRVVRPGARARVVPYDNRGCLFDVAFRFEGGHTVNRRKLDLCNITELSTTGQGVGVPNRNERPRSYQDFHTLYPGGPQVPHREPVLREIPTFTRGTAI